MKNKHYDYHLSEAVRWWERYRIVYNLILLGVVAYFFIRYFPRIELYGLNQAVFESILFLITANAFYSFGLLLEVLFPFYFKKEVIPEVRHPLLLTGITFAILITIDLYKAGLGIY